MAAGGITAMTVIDWPRGVNIDVVLALAKGEPVAVPAVEVELESAPVRSGDGCSESVANLRRNPRWRVRPLFERPVNGVAGRRSALKL
jgi:hypothetical protein